MEDIAGALLRVAREQNATQILVGKPNRHSFSVHHISPKNLIKT